MVKRFRFDLLHTSSNKTAQGDNLDSGQKHGKTKPLGLARNCLMLLNLWTFDAWMFLSQSQCTQFQFRITRKISTQPGIPQKVTRKCFRICVTKYYQGKSTEIRPRAFWQSTTADEFLSSFWWFIRNSLKTKLTIDAHSNKKVVAMRELHSQEHGLV